MNPSLSNSPWIAKDDGEEADDESKPPRDKRTGLKVHSVLHLNKHLVTHDEWNEEEIVARSRRLAETICEIWPRPDNATAAPVDEPA